MTDDPELQALAELEIGDPITALGEEAAEVAKEVLKYLRFGDSYVNINGNTNFENLVQEVADFMTILSICVGKGLITEEQLGIGMVNKIEKLEEQFEPQTNND